MKKFLMEIDENQLFIPDEDWMAINYSKMNRLLFDNRLGNCNFEIFKTGKGSNGNVLGWFCIQNKNIRYSKSTRQMFDIKFGRREYVNHDNFVALCKPCIKLNGNYRWTEKAAISTLVHEMCHYYCEMNGFVPVQAHGREFKSIAAYVSSKSNNFFTVQTLASAEQMDEMVLDSEIKAKNDLRKQNKLSKTILMFIWKNNYEVRLVKPTTMDLVYKILNIEKIEPSTTKIQISYDENLKNVVFDEGYTSTMTKYRYWDVTNDNFVKHLDEYNMETLYSKENKQSMPQTYNKPIEQPKPVSNIIPLFRFKTVQGNTFEVRNSSKEEIKKQLQQRFPKWPESSIERVLNNPKYYFK